MYTYLCFLAVAIKLWTKGLLLLQKRCSTCQAYAPCYVGDSPICGAWWKCMTSHAVSNWDAFEIHFFSCRCIRILVSKITVSSFMLQISSNTFSTTLLFRFNSPFLLVPLSPGYIRVILCCNKASLSSNRHTKHILKEHVIGVLNFTQY